MPILPPVQATAFQVLNASSMTVFAVSSGTVALASLLML